MRTKIFGHRGAKGYYPENSLLSFEKALDMGVDGLELDVHYSKDGVIVVFHDFELNRMTGATGMIFEKTWKELSKLRLKDEHYETGIPTLEMVLQLIVKKQNELNKTVELNVEFKAGSGIYKGIEQEVVALCLNYLPKEQLIFSSFDHFAHVAIKSIDKSLRTGVLTTAAMVNPWEYVEKLEADFYHPYCLTLASPILESYEKVGLLINTYTVNDPKQAKLLKSLGVYGIITDIPDKIIEA